VSNCTRTCTRHAFVTWIVLKGEETRGTEKVALLFLDAYGKVVRSKMVRAGEAEQLIGAWSDGYWIEMDRWEEGEPREENKDNSLWVDMSPKSMWTTRELWSQRKRLWYVLGSVRNPWSRDTHEKDGKPKRNVTTRDGRCETL